MLTGITQLYRQEEESSLDTTLFDHEHRLFLSFMIETDAFGIHIDHILEVKSWADVKIRSLVRSPDFLLGVFNLRGNIVPVVDLRKKWNTERVEYTDKTAVVVLNIQKRIWAIVVDKINEVAGLKREDILPAPMLSHRLDVRYFSGIANRHGYSLVLLDIEKVMTSDEMGLIDNLAKE